MSSSGVKYSIRFERLELLGEVKEEEMKEMRKLLAELHKKISSSQEEENKLKFVPMKKIKQALTKLTDNAALLVQGAPPSQYM